MNTPQMRHRGPISELVTVATTCLALTLPACERKDETQSTPPVPKLADGLPLYPAGAPVCAPRSYNRVIEADGFTANEARVLNDSLYCLEQVWRANKDPALELLKAVKCQPLDEKTIAAVRLSAQLSESARSAGFTFIPLDEKKVADALKNLSASSEARQDKWKRRAERLKELGIPIASKTTLEPP